MYVFYALPPRTQRRGGANDARRTAIMATMKTSNRWLSLYLGAVAVTFSASVLASTSSTDCIPGESLCVAGRVPLRRSCCCGARTPPTIDGLFRMHPFHQATAYRTVVFNPRSPFLGGLCCLLM